MLTTKRFDDALNPKHDRHGPPEEIPYGLSCLCFALFYSLLLCFNGIGFGNWDSARYRFSFIRIASSHLIPRLCVSFLFFLLSAVFLASRAFFFCFLLSPMSPVVGFIQPLDTDRGLSHLMRTKRRQKDDQPLHPEVYLVNYKSVGEFFRRLDATNIFLTRDFFFLD